MFTGSKVLRIYWAVKGVQGISSPVIPLALKHAAVTIGSIGPYLLDQSKMMAFASKMPNGDGEMLAGWAAYDNRDLKSADQHLRAALAAPALIDCRRFTACLLTICNWTDFHNRGIPDAQAAPVIEADLDRLISLGGVYVDLTPGERMAVDAADHYRFYSQFRTLAQLWLIRIPDDPQALYFLALADYRLGQRDLALPLFKRVVNLNLDAGMKANARAKILELSGPTTKP